MRAFIPGHTVATLVKDIQTALKGHPMEDVLKLEEKGKDVVVTIHKLGTSVLTFSTLVRDGGVEITLAGEKLAMAHKAFKDEVKNRLAALVEKLGGNVISR